MKKKQTKQTANNYRKGWLCVRIEPVITEAIRDAADAFGCSPQELTKFYVDMGMVLSAAIAMFSARKNLFELDRKSKAKK